MFVSWIIVARLLGKTSFGELGMIRSTLGMFGVFAGFGLGLTSTKFVAEFRRSNPEKAGRILGLSSLVSVITGGIISLALIWMAPTLANGSLNAPHLTNPLRLGAIMLFLNALNGAQSGALAGFEVFKTIAFVNLFVGLGSFPLLLIGTHYGGLNGAVLGIIAGLFINWLLNHIVLRKTARSNAVPIILGCLKSDWKVLINFSLPAMLSSSLVGPVNWICYTLLVNRSNGYSEMSIISATDNWFTLILYFPELLAHVFLPIVSAQNVGNENKANALKFASKVNLITIFFPVLIACIASPFIMSLYGDDFRDGWATLVVTLSTAFLMAAFLPVGSLITASGRMWVRLAINIIWAASFVSLTWLFDDLGAFGLSIARGVAYLIQSVCLFSLWFHIFHNKHV